jgi:hypothetical protein
MVKLTELTKDFKAKNADYVLDKEDKLLALLPYLLPKLKGDWYVVMVDPRMSLIRNLLDSNLVPEYVKLEMVIDPGFLDQLTAERPSLKVTHNSVREIYDTYIATFPKTIDPRAKDEIYYRIGPNLSSLREALDILSEKVVEDNVTIKDVRLYIPDHRRVYASTVMKSFLLKEEKRWDLLNTYEKDLGTDFAFYALRKYSRKLLKEKNDYLKNKEVKDRLVERVDSFTIMHAVYAFELATSPIQLYIVMNIIDKRERIPIYSEGE